jgi:bile acid:Na+ symporter, BASS family
MVRRLTDLFPLWALLTAAMAYALPRPFAAMSAAIAPLLGLVMLAMGLTLTVRSFRPLLSRPRALLVGTVSQFGLMPLIAWTVARLLALPPELAVGVVLVGASPGGTASNVIAYLARGDLPLSIALTSVSTLLAVLLTPALTWLYLGTAVDVPAGDMVVTVGKLVLAPVILGVIVNTYFGSRLERLRPLLPLVSVLCIVLIIGIIVALSADTLAQVAPLLLLAVALHNALGLGAGYLGATLFRLSEAERRTVTIEVGMQNSGLAVALAAQYFTAVSALPGAVFSLWHNLTGAYLAARWGRRSLPGTGVKS